MPFRLFQTESSAWTTEAPVRMLAFEIAKVLSFDLVELVAFLLDFADFLLALFSRPDEPARLSFPCDTDEREYLYCMSVTLVVCQPSRASKT